MHPVFSSCLGVNLKKKMIICSYMAQVIFLFSLMEFGRKPLMGNFVKKL